MVVSTDSAEAVLGPVSSREVEQIEPHTHTQKKSIHQTNKGAMSEASTLPRWKQLERKSLSCRVYKVPWILPPHNTSAHTAQAARPYASEVECHLRRGNGTATKLL